MAIRKGENEYIYGLHDRGGEHLLIDNNQAKGWVLVTEEIRADPNDRGHSNYQDLADRGLGVIVRLNHAYGNDGTIPPSAKYDDFARRAANFVAGSPGCHIWIIGNEMNLEREQPRGEPITPRRYAECYRRCRQAIKGLPGHQNDQVLVGAIGPWNGETPYDADPQGAYPANKIPGAPNAHPYNGFFGDFIQYMIDMLVAIGARNCDGIAIHAYSHGYHPDMVYNTDKMGPPFQNYYFNFFTYRDQMQAIPAAFRHLPVYLTEANGDQQPDGSRWPDVNSGWVKNAYGEINNWNIQPGNQQIRCMILYRWSRDDAWHIAGKGQVHNDIREAVARNYRWNPDAIAARPSDTGTPTLPIDIPTETGLVIEDVRTQLPTNDSVAPYPTRPVSAIKRLVIHHTATGATLSVNRLAAYQVTQRDFPAISYHFCITAEGKAYQTQSLEIVTQQAGRFSDDSVGVCLIGNFTNDPPPDAQLSAVAGVLAHLAQQLKLQVSETTIVGYQDLITTASPGATWPSWKGPLIATTAKLLGQNIIPPTIETPPEPETPQIPPYRTEFIQNTTPTSYETGQTLTVTIALKNVGSFTWVRAGSNPFHLGFRWINRANQVVPLPEAFDFRTPLPNDVRPNQTVTVEAKLRTPDTPGIYRLQWDMVHENITWFTSQGDSGQTLDNIRIERQAQPAPEPVTPPVTPVVPPTSPILQPPASLAISDVRASLPTNTNVEPYGKRSQNQIRRFIIHHTATAPTLTVERLANFQVNNQQKPGISFHFCIDANGEIFYTQSLDVLTIHAGTFSNTSVGICLIGNFNPSPPPAAQIQATAKLLAYLGDALNRPMVASAVLGYSELINTQSPGTTWLTWKETLVNQARALQSGQPQPLPITPPAPDGTPSITPAPKVIEHYLLLWHQSSSNWAEWDLISAIDYMGQFKPTVGFSIDEAKHARYVTIVGGPGGVPATAEATLQQAGCQVERLNGRTAEETNQMLYDLVAANKRFRTL